MTDATASTPLKHTPLRDVHVKAGAKMVPFGGWDMPVQYTGIIDEHRTVRGAVGLFDISHMGEFEVRGADALASVQRLCTNASNIDKDWAWVTSHSEGRAQWTNVSDETALLAVQGPKAEALVARLADRDVTGIDYYHFARGKVAGVEGLISRTGYTGEDGFELYVPAGQAERLWSALLEAGRGDGIKPIGLGARDTLRLEMKYALYGNDIDQTTNPLEAGLGWVVKPAKGEFIGRAAVEALRARGVGRKLVGFEMVERAVPRHGYRLLAGGAPVGVVTSGSFGPSVERSIGMGYVASSQTAVGTALTVEIRGALHPARVVKTPFHPSHTKKA